MAGPKKQDLEALRSYSLFKTPSMLSMKIHSRSSSSATGFATTSRQREPTQIMSTVKRAFTFGRGRTVTMDPDAPVLQVDIDGAELVTSAGGKVISKELEEGQGEENERAGKNLPRDGDSQSIKSANSKFSLGRFRLKGSSTKQNSETATDEPETFMVTLKKSFTVKKKEKVDKVGKSDSTQFTLVQGSTSQLYTSQDLSLSQSSESIELVKTILSEEELLKPVVVPASPSKVEAKLPSSQTAFHTKKRIHSSSVDQILDNIYESQETLGSLSSIPDIEATVDDNAEGLEQRQNSSITKYTLPFRSRDSLATVRNSLAPVVGRLSVSQLKESATERETKVGIDINIILERLSDIRPPILPESPSSGSITSFPRPLNHNESNSSCCENSSYRTSLTTRFLQISRNSVTSVTRGRSHTSATATAASAPTRSFKPAQSEATNALDRLGVEYMTSTPYSWWWLSGLSGDSVIPDSLGFVEPTFHECTTFNTEGKRPGFKRLVLRPLKKLIGVETPEQDSTDLLDSTEAVTARPPFSSARRVARKSSITLERNESTTSQYELNNEHGASLTTTITKVYAKASVTQPISTDGFEPPEIQTCLISSVSKLKSQVSKIASICDNDSRLSQTSKKHVLWDESVLGVGNSSDVLDTFLEQVEKPPRPSAVDIPGMVRIRRRSTVASIPSSLFLTEHQHQPEAKRVLDSMSMKRKEIEELDATILRCSAETGGRNPFVKALLLQRARLVKEMEALIS
ncbi:hypothetical protein BC830DRAFT_1132069 [Chytriomyces sp. MP71]|nr:hypothetical protein BC830DRAFT_1132069 [Chytriomyces sp. MP71]